MIMAISSRVLMFNVFYGITACVFMVPVIGLYTLLQEINFQNLAVTILLKIALGILLLLSTLLSAACLHIVFISKSESHTVTSIALQYVLYTVNRFVSSTVKRGIQTACRQPRKAQEELLRNFLRKNQSTEYGRLNKFCSIKNLRDFRKCHPLTKYSHYGQYIERMITGEQNILMAANPTRFALTSGTSGNAKVLPVSSELERNLYHVMGVLRDRISLDTFKQFSPLQKIVRLYWEPKWKTTPSNHILGPLSKLNPKYKRLVSVTSSSPTAVFSMQNIEMCTYIHSLFAIRERFISLFMTSYTTSLYVMMRYLEDHWHDMVEDIRTGTINSDLDLPSDVRLEIEESLQPDPVRAEEARAEFQKGFDGIIQRLWPSCVAVCASDAAGIKSSLQRTYCKGLPLYGTTYTATEGLLGVNLWPKRQGDRDQFLLLPSMNIMEFIEEENIKEDQPDTLFIDELARGGTYELVLTTQSGLCRFRFGDVIKVVDYHGNCPVVEFQYRSGQMMDVCGEKVDQSVIGQVMADTESSWGQGCLVDYACAESNLLIQGGKDPGLKPYYIFFVEIRNSLNENISKTKSDLIHQLLCKKSFSYNYFVEENKIAPAVVHLVKCGSFKTLQEYIINNTSASMNQFKNHRKLQTWEIMELMLKNVI